MQRFGLDLSAREDKVFAAFYQESMDWINWTDVIRMARILDETEEYEAINYSLDNQGRAGMILGHVMWKVEKLKRKSEENIESKEEGEKAGLHDQIISKGIGFVQKGFSFGAGLFKKKST